MTQADTVQASTPDSSPAGPDDLFARLQALGVPITRHDHKPLFTVADGLEIERDIPGAHCRNLFLRDKKGVYFLLVLLNETKVDMKKLAALLGCGKLSFGSPENLWRLLGVRPGAVCPFSIMNDRDREVTLYLDASMMAADIVNYHPLVNTATIGLAPQDLLRFVKSCGRETHIIDLSPAAPDERAADQTKE